MSPTPRMVPSPTPAPEMLALAHDAYDEARTCLAQDGGVASCIYFQAASLGRVFMPPPQVQDDVLEEVFANTARAIIGQLHPDYYVAVHQVWTVLPDAIEKTIDAKGGAVMSPSQHPRREEALAIILCTPDSQWSGLALITRDEAGHPTVPQDPPLLAHDPECRGPVLGNFFKSARPPTSQA